MTDILLRMNAAAYPIVNYNQTARNICNIFKDKKYEDYKNGFKEQDKEQDKVPFENFLVYFGLDKQEAMELADRNCKGDIIPTRDEDKLRKDLNRRRIAVMNFALQYSHLAQESDKFNPQSLQQSAEDLNSILNPIVSAINRDVEELFIEPTLAEIQNIVREYGDVEYAEVGKTSVAGLNGLQSKVISETVSTFDQPPPLRLNELLKEANISADALLPTAGTNAIPAASVAKLIAALSADRSNWRGLTSGASMTITPSVLRNSASAELGIEFRTGPETVREETDNGRKLRPLSRISQNTVNTSVYVNTLDIFALSTFNNQTTIDGGRTYIPLIGTIWQGIFSGIPIFGDLFSWKNSPKNVQHQSIALTNTFIVPTAMGLAPLYNPTGSNYIYNDLFKEVEDYIDQLKRENEKIQQKQRQQEKMSEP